MSIGVYIYIYIIIYIYICFTPGGGRRPGGPAGGTFLGRFRDYRVIFWIFIYFWCKTGSFTNRVSKGTGFRPFHVFFCVFLCVCVFLPPSPPPIDFFKGLPIGDPPASWHPPKSHCFITPAKVFASSQFAKEFLVEWKSLGYSKQIEQLETVAQHWSWPRRQHPPVLVFWHQDSGLFWYHNSWIEFYRLIQWNM